MDPVPVQVQCHAGYKADESPRRFLCEGSQIEVVEVLDSWLAAGKNAKDPKSDYFKVRGSDGHDYLLRLDLDADCWHVVNRW